MLEVVVGVGVGSSFFLEQAPSATKHQRTLRKRSSKQCHIAMKEQKKIVLG
jgi:hypothetical protein